MANTERWTPTRCPKCGSDKLYIVDHEARCLDCILFFTFAIAYDVPGMDPRPEMIHCPDPNGVKAFNFTWLHPDIGDRETRYTCPTCGNECACYIYCSPDKEALTQREPYCYWCCEKVDAKPWKPPLKVKRHTDTGPRQEAEALEAAGQYSLFDDPEDSSGN